MKGDKFYRLVVAASLALAGCAPETLVASSSISNAALVTGADALITDSDLGLATVGQPMYKEPGLSQEGVATADFKVPAGFDFKQTFALEVSVSNSQDRSGYLSVCIDFTRLGPTYDVNYANCQLRATLDGDFAATLELPNNVPSVVAVVWYFEPGQSADFALWERGSDAPALLQVVL